MTRDIRNVNRGRCQACKDCRAFTVGCSRQVLCNYCGCPPAQHENLDKLPVLTGRGRSTHETWGAIGGRPKPTKIRWDPEASYPTRTTARKLRAFHQVSSRKKRSPQKTDSIPQPSPASKTPAYSQKMPPRLEVLFDTPRVSQDVQLEHAWSPDDHSYNMYVKAEDKLTFHRHPMAQSSDGIRGKVAYERGLHLFEITWPTNHRGTHATIGVSTSEAPIQVVGYHSLVGLNDKSWGWDLGRLKAFHNAEGQPYPLNLSGDETLEVPEKFHVVLDLDQGVLGFVVKGHYLGPAFTGLQGKKLHLMVSAVWGHAEVTLKYLGGLEPGPVSLMALCRHTIRKSISKKDHEVDHGQINAMHLPKTIIEYLGYSD